MALLEKYTFKRIEKDIHPLSLSTDGQRRLVPGNVYHVENARIASSQGENEESVENVLGNEEWVNVNLPSGANKVVGCVEDIEKYSLIFFVYNELGNHSIHRFYGITNTFEKILEWQGLNFSGKPITGIAIIEHHVVWTDESRSPRYLNLSNVPSQPDVKNTSLYLRRPVVAPFVQALSGVSKINLIREDNWRFSYRYQYKSGGYSKLSPVSRMILAEPESTSILNNQRISVSVQVTDFLLLKDHLYSIELLYKKNDSENWYVFKEIVNPSQELHIIYFDNTSIGSIVPKQEVTTSDEDIPLVTKAMAAFKNRIFLTRDSVGRDVNEIQIVSSTIEERTDKTYNLKGGGAYSWGVKCTDGDASNSLVLKGGGFSVNYGGVSDNSAVLKSANLKVVVRLPDWAKRVQLVVSKNRYNRNYVQFPAYLASFNNVDETGDLGTTLWRHNASSRVYFKTLRRGHPIHVLFPDNLPFRPEVGMHVRMVSMATGKELPFKKIINVYDSAFECDDFDEVDADFQSNVLVDVFSIYKGDEDEEIFYEIADQEVTGVGDISIESDIGFDTFKFTTKFNYANALGAVTADNWLTTGDQDSDNWVVNGRGFSVESPSTATSVTTQTITYNNNQNQDIVRVNTADYTKSTQNLGQAFVEQKRQGSDEQSNVISFSDTHIVNTFTNGIHNFDASNRRSISRELGPIMALLPIRGNIMLAIHQRECSSLSIGEGFVKVGDENFILQKTESVVGDDRPLTGGFGTAHPESAVAHQGRGFFFDIHRGAVLRYTSNGIYPISYHGMKVYFENKAKELLPYKDQINIIGGIDPFHKEYLITFPEINGIPSETWGFNYEKNVWTCKYSFVPEMYGVLGNRLVSFKDGKLWEHNKGLIYNNFYGVQYERKIILYSNPMAHVTKRVLNCHVLANELATDPEYKVIEVRTPNGQESYIKLKKFEEQEHTFYAQFFKDIHSKVGQGKIALLDGKDIRDKYFEIEINSNLTTQALLHEVTIALVDSDYNK